MKKMILLYCIAMLTFVFSIAQTFSDGNFLGDDYKLYKGVLFKFNSGTTDPLSNKFYSNIIKARLGHSEGVLYATLDDYAGSSDGYTQIALLLGHTWKVINIESDEYDIYPPIFTLQDIKTNELIYFKYDKSDADAFPFLTTPIKFTLAFATSKIERIETKKDNNVSFYSPFNTPLGISKTIENGETYFYLNVSITSAGKINGTGAVVEFTDGSKWEKLSEKIDSEQDVYDEEKWNSRSFSSLTPEEVVKFSKIKVNKIRLNNTEMIISGIEKEKFILFCEAITLAK